MRNLQKLTVVCASLFSVSAYADRYDLHWDNDKASGSFTDPGMWEDAAGKPSPDFDKGASRWFRIGTKKTGTNTVVLADYNLLGGINGYIWGDGALVIDGKDVVFRQQAPADGSSVNTTGYDPFTVRDNDYGFTALSFIPVSRETSSTFSFSNSLQTLSRSTGESWFRWHLSRGSFSFAGPDGSNAEHTLAIGSGGRGENLFKVDFDGVDVTLPVFEHQCYTTNSLVTVNGGTMTILGGFKYDASGSAVGGRAFTGTNDFNAVNSAKVMQKGGSMTIGLAGNADKRCDRLTVSGEGTSWTVGADAGNMAVHANGQLHVRDGAAFSFMAPKKVTFGATDNASGQRDDRTRLAVDGASTVFDISRASSFAVNCSSVAAFSGGATAILPNSCVIGVNPWDEPAVMNVEGDGTVVSIAVKSDGTQSLRLGETYGSGTVNVKGGLLRGAPDNRTFMFRLGINEGNAGTLNVSGGTVDVGSGGYAQLTVGMSGDGTVNLSGGEIVSGKIVALGYGNAMKSLRTSVLNQTGGLLRVAGDGVVLNYFGDTANRRSFYHLNGGTAVVTRIYGEKTLAQGFLGRAELHADGGTIRPSEKRFTEAKPLICGLDLCALGPKGLTIDTGAYDTLVRQPMTDKENEDGLLIKKGSAALLLTGGAYDVAKTRVDEGTLLVTNETAALETELIVNEGAAFSLVGTAKTVRLSSLTVDGGVIRLDPGDKMIVDGPVSLKDVHFSFSSLPQLNSDAPDVLECAGRLDDASAKALKRALIENVAADGAYVEISFAYDEETGKTSVKAAHATESAPLGDDAATIWQGAVQDWLLADNWSAGVPSSSKLAVFSGCDGVKTVAATAGANAAAISFRADGYTLAGDGPVNISGRRGEAKIEVASGVSASVAAPLSLNTVTELSVAEGGRLSLAGPISDGGIEKTGSGSLILEGEGDYFREAAFLGGMSTVRSPDALKGAPLVKLGGNATIAFSVESGLASPVEVSSTGDEPAIFKADADVSVGSLSVAGAFIKRGTGCLTIDASTGKDSILTTVTREQSASGCWLTYFPEDGSAPAVHGWTGFTVAEGDVVLKGGTGEFKAPGTITIGLNATNMNESAQARLVVDGAVLDNLTSVSKPLYIGYGTSLQYTRQFTPTLVVKNGGLVKTHTLYVGANTYGGSGNHPTLAVTNSAVYASSNFALTGVDVADDNAAFTRARDSLLLTGGGFSLQGRFDAEFDNTFVGKGSSEGTPLSAPAKLRVTDYNKHMPKGTLAFRNGSVLSACFENLSYPTQSMAFVWDGSEWRWAENLGDFTFASSSVNPELFSFRMEGRGLILKPAAGAVFETEVPFTGPGGFVNAGAGTVRFGAGTFAFGGVCETVAGATTDLSAAGPLSGKSFSGAGTVKGAALSNAVISLAANDDWSIAEVPLFDGCTFSGTVWVDLGRTADNPLSEEMPESLTVARVTGVAPDVTQWRLKGYTTGLSSLIGMFSVDASSGEVRMAVKRSGFIMLVR